MLLRARGRRGAAPWSGSVDYHRGPPPCGGRPCCSPARTPPRGRPKRSRRGRRQRRRRRLIPKRPTASCRSARTRSRRRCGIGRNDGAEADERRGPWRDQWCYAHHPDLPRCAWPRWALPQPPSYRATHAPTRHAVGLVTPVAANQIAASAARRAYAYIVVEFVTIDVLLRWLAQRTRPSRQLACMRSGGGSPSPIGTIGALLDHAGWASGPSSPVCELRNEVGRQGHRS